MEKHGKTRSCCQDGFSGAPPVASNSFQKYGPSLSLPAARSTPGRYKASSVRQQRSFTESRGCRGLQVRFKMGITYMIIDPQKLGYNLDNYGYMSTYSRNCTSKWGWTVWNVFANLKWCIMATRSNQVEQNRPWFGVFGLTRNRRDTEFSWQQQLSSVQNPSIIPFNPGWFIEIPRSWIMK